MTNENSNNQLNGANKYVHKKFTYKTVTYALSKNGVILPFSMIVINISKFVYVDW